MIKYIKGRLAKKKIDNTIRQAQDKIMTKELPIIVLDSDWYNIKKIIKIKDVENKERLLTDGLKEVASLREQILNHKESKEILLDKILEFSDEVNHKQDHTHLRLLGSAKTDVEKLNKEIEAKEARLVQIELDLQNINRQVIDEVTREGYAFMAKHRPKIQELSKEVDELRAKMVEVMKEKKAYEIQYKTFYQYLHHVIGYQAVQTLDKEVEEQSK